MALSLNWDPNTLKEKNKNFKKYQDLTKTIHSAFEITLLVKR